MDAAAPRGAQRLRGMHRGAASRGRRCECDGGARRDGAAQLGDGGGGGGDGKVDRIGGGVGEGGCGRMDAGALRHAIQQLRLPQVLARGGGGAGRARSGRLDGHAQRRAQRQEPLRRAADRVQGEPVQEEQAGRDAAAHRVSEGQEQGGREDCPRGEAPPAGGTAAAGDRQKRQDGRGRHRVRLHPRVDQVGRHGDERARHNGERVGPRGTHARTRDATTRHAHRARPARFRPLHHPMTGEELDEADRSLIS
mmetsp:Transcript_30814/g.73213  ORF Transcript_30814/g.73213 Transcript_30814/m.73213 type:complete len:252 (+) Transcript_30814:576-1331(+)